MTARVVISKLTHNEANVKVMGPAASDAGTITVATDLKLASDTLSTPIVDINKIMWSVATGTGNYITITRNSVVVAILYGTGEMDLNARGMIEDEQNDSTTIVVTFTGSSGMCWLKLKKTTGWGD